LILILIPISILVNIYLLLSKGNVLFAENVGDARVVFYEGWGLTQRFNSTFIYLLGIYSVKQSILRKVSKPMLWFSWIWTIYLITSLGSKSGFITLLICYGCYKSYYPHKLNVHQSIAIISSVTVGSMLLFWLYFGNDLIIQFGVRMMANADGPFYYFGLTNKIHVTPAYPFQNLLTALRILPYSSELSLGPAINYQYFDYYSPNFGPNPQIFSESEAIFNSLFPIYYILVGVVIGWMLKHPRTPYSLGLVSSVTGALLLDSQYAFSLLLNVVVIFVLRILVTTAYSVRSSR